jgi:hypothetical protein
MDWEADYRQLAALMALAADRFAEVYGRAEFVLDFEYKKNVGDGTLIIKQVREVPRPDATPSVVPFLLGGTAELVTFQGEYGDVFANHRLKTRLHIGTEGLKLSTENLAQTIFGDAEIEYAAEGQVRNFAAPLGAWPEFSHSYAEETSRDAWAFNALGNPRRYVLSSQFPALVSPADNPLFTLSDASGGLIPLEVTYARPEPGVDWAVEPTTVTQETVLLTVARTGAQEGDLLQERVCEGPGGVKITTAYYWPAPPRGVSAGYTAPLVRWEETRIEGYTEEPIVLTGFYSQTYRPEHHNFSEHFIFEPQLEEGLSEAVLQELRAADIRLIHCYANLDGGSTITTYGFDGAGGEGEGEGEGEQPGCRLEGVKVASARGDLLLFALAFLTLTGWAHLRG